jgi:hypothetical protein
MGKPWSRRSRGFFAGISHSVVSSGVRPSFQESPGGRATMADRFNGGNRWSIDQKPQEMGHAGCVLSSLPGLASSFALVPQ